MTQKTEGQTLQVAGTTFEIIEALRKLDGATVTEVADHLDLPKSTAHIYLKTLDEHNYTVREDAEYHLSLQFLKYGGFVRSSRQVFPTAKSEIDELAEKTGDGVNLGIEEKGKRVLLYTAEGPDAITDNATIGEHKPMNQTAMGKALLAHLPDSRVREIIDQHGLPSATTHTITDPDELFKELGTIRDQGYAIEDEEHINGAKGVSVPILTDHGLLGAITIAGPKARLSEERISEELVDALVQTANVIKLRYEHY